MTREIKVGDTVKLRDDTEREGYTLLQQPYEDNPTARVLAVSAEYVVVDQQLDGALFWNADQLEHADE